MEEGRMRRKRTCQEFQVSQHPGLPRNIPVIQSIISFVKIFFSDQFMLSLVVSFIELISVERFPSTAL